MHARTPSMREKVGNAENTGHEIHVGEIGETQLQRKSGHVQVSSKRACRSPIGTLRRWCFFSSAVSSLACEEEDDEEDASVAVPLAPDPLAEVDIGVGGTVGDAAIVCVVVETSGAEELAEEDVVLLLLEGELTTKDGLEGMLLLLLLLPGTDDCCDAGEEEEEGEGAMDTLTPGGLCAGGGGTGEDIPPSSKRNCFVWEKRNGCRYQGRGKERKKGSFEAACACLKKIQNSMEFFHKVFCLAMNVW